MVSLQIDEDSGGNFITPPLATKRTTPLPVYKEATRKKLEMFLPFGLEDKLILD